MANRILIVDDNRDTVEMLGALLSYSGYEIVSAGTAAEARSRVGDERIDLIILDSWLPDGDGVVLCRELRSRLPSLPIVFLSAAGLQADLDRAAEAGCNVYLTKPRDIDELTQVVEQVINTSQRETKAPIG